MKKCNICKIMKSLEDFGFKAKKSSRKGECKECCSHYQRAYLYGVSIDGYNELVNKQNRGLLCQDCNMAIGTFGDELEGLLAAKDYLIK